MLTNYPIHRRLSSDATIAQMQRAKVIEFHGGKEKRGGNMYILPISLVKRDDEDIWDLYNISGTDLRRYTKYTPKKSFNLEQTVDFINNYIETVLEPQYLDEWYVGAWHPLEFGCVLVYPVKHREHDENGNQISILNDMKGHKTSLPQRKRATPKKRSPAVKVDVRKMF